MEKIWPSAVHGKVSFATSAGKGYPVRLEILLVKNLKKLLQSILIYAKIRTVTEVW